ncbi:MAG: zinc-binding alcohol dehydrogenase family protein [Bryobacteraceae bacterium]
MNAAVIHSFEHPPRFESFEEPVAHENEVLIRVHAAAVHPVVRAMASGVHYGTHAHFPVVAGLDGAGETADGRRVYFFTFRKPFGSMAETAVASKSVCIPIPDGLDYETAAAIVNPAMSSWLALKLRAKMIEGETVMVLGATGAAGRLAVPLAKILGARHVIAVGRNLKTLQQLQSHGADDIVSLHQSDDALMKTMRSASKIDTAEGGVNIVLDYLWGRPAECLIQTLTKKGLTGVSQRIRFIQIGDSAGKTIPLPAASLRSSALELIGSGAGSFRLDGAAADLAELLKVVAEHKLHVDIETEPLSNVEAAWNKDIGGKRLVIRM